MKSSGSRACAAVVLLASATVGCGATYPGPAVVLLGTGVVRFEPIEDCGRVPIIHGPQGGYHVWGSIRARYLDLHRAVARFSVENEAGALLPYPDGIANPMQETVDLLPLVDAGTVLGSPEDDAAECPDGGRDLDGGAAFVTGGADGWSESDGLRIFIPYTTNSSGVYVPDADVDGRRVRIELHVTDADGRSAGDVRSPFLYYDQ